MSWRRWQCRLMGHHWTRHADHAEWGAPQLVRCRRCGYVSSREAEQRRLMNGLGGSARGEP